MAFTPSAGNALLPTPRLVEGPPLTKIATLFVCLFLVGTFIASHYLSPLGSSALAFEPIHQSLVVKVKKTKRTTMMTTTSRRSRRTRSSRRRAGRRSIAKLDSLSWTSPTSTAPAARPGKGFRRLNSKRPRSVSSPARSAHHRIAVARTIRRSLVTKGAS